MDWQLTCRVCLESGEMVSLFDWDENNEMLGDKYAYCCGIQVKRNDTLPTLICLNCVDRLTLAYQFRKQCLSSNETLKECLDEFIKTSAAAAENKIKEPRETETITIKQENGVLLQYELPIEHEPTMQWTRTVSSNKATTVITKAPEPKKRGRPRKYPNQNGVIYQSPYIHKKPKQVKEELSLTSLLESGSLEGVKEEPEDLLEEGDGNNEEETEDPEYNPGSDHGESEPEDDVEKAKGRPRGRPRKVFKGEDTDDVLLKETIMAFSEPIPNHLLKRDKPKKKYANKKKYVYEKSHTCETCGSSFTSNATLQAHIRRHLGIKPFVCSVCGYASVLNEALKRHMLKHTGEKPYKCRICDRRFGDYGTRQKHERLHLGIRPYQCSLCGKAFTYSYVLANHMLTHTGEKKYSCTPCNKKFTKAHHLKYHNKVHHKELYMQQQLEYESKKMREKMNMNKMTGLISGQIIDGKLQIIQTGDEILSTEEIEMENGVQMELTDTMIEEEEEEVEEGEGEIEEEKHEEGEEEKISPDLDLQTETHSAVAGMQGVILDEDFCIQEDEDTNIEGIEYSQEM